MSVSVHGRWVLLSRRAASCAPTFLVPTMALERGAAHPMWLGREVTGGSESHWGVAVTRADGQVAPGRVQACARATATRLI